MATQHLSHCLHSGKTYTAYHIWASGEGGWSKMAKNVQQNKCAKVRHKCNKQRWPMCNDNSALLTSNPFFPMTYLMNKPI